MKIRWKELVLSLAMAVGLWYGISGSEKIETQIEVRVDYRGIPADLVVLNGLISKINVRVKASVGQLGMLYNRDSPAFLMDLSGIKKGKNTLPIPLSKFPFWGGVEVIDAIPSHITLEVESLKTKVVPIRVNLANLTEKQRSSLKVIANPSKVTIKGPEQSVNAVEFVSVLSPAPVTSDGALLNQQVVLSVPNSVDIKPSYIELIMQPKNGEGNE